MKKEDKKYLKKEAHYLKAIFQIGKDGISENLLEGLDAALVAHELIKIHLLKTVPTEKTMIINQLCTNLNCELIDSIGKMIVLYRKSNKNLYEL